MISIKGDGCFSFDEFVEIVSNMGNPSTNTAEEEEKELRDAFRVSSSRVYLPICKNVYLYMYIFNLELFM